MLNIKVVIDVVHRRRAIVPSADFIIVFVVFVVVDVTVHPHIIFRLQFRLLGKRCRFGYSLAIVASVCYIPLASSLVDHGRFTTGSSDDNVVRILSI
jgi:hypothetical protein